MLERRVQNRKRKNHVHKEKRERSPKNVHISRMKTAALFGLLLGGLVCYGLVEIQPILPQMGPIRLTVQPSVETTDDVTPDSQKEESVKNPLRGPERVIDVSTIHPALGKVINNRFVQELPENHEVTFTINARVQARAEKILSENNVPFGALVAIDPRDGRIIAMVDYEAKQGLHTGFALEAQQPAASVFKVISTAALMEHAGISPQEKVCYHGGKSGVSKANLTPNKRLDTLCRSLSDALAHSSNVVFARLADRHLDPQSLTTWGNRFGFNQEIPFLWDVEPSLLQLPSERVAFAGSAAGFHHSYISPLHGALLTAAIGNGGVLPVPHLVDEVKRDGFKIYSAEPSQFGTALADATGKNIAKMMTKTTKSGTAAKYFNKKHRILRGIDVAAKTGSLSSTTGGKRRHNSWFVAFAPAENPRIALAALVVNDPAWKIKGTFLGREILEEFFLSEKADSPAPSSR